MSVEARFSPSYGKGVIVAAGAASAKLAIGLGSKTICFTNLSAVLTYVRISNDSAVASTADYPILANAQVWVSKDQDFDTVTYIAPAGGGSLHVMPGEGF